MTITRETDAAGSDPRFEPPALNNLNRTSFSHTRTLSNPLPLIPECVGGTGTIIYSITPSTSSASTSLTDALNLDFVNIPSEKEFCAIPPQAMQKYLEEGGMVGHVPSTSRESSHFLVDLTMGSSTESPERAEVTKVLDNFSALLEQIVSSEGISEGSPNATSAARFIPPSTPSCSNSTAKIKNSVEAFAELLLRGEEYLREDEDLLIVIESGDLNTGSSTNDNSVCGNDCEEDEIGENDDEDGEVQGLPNETDLELEGYESDRPMVRASMRKLKPIKVKLKPVEESIQEASNSAESSPERASSSSNLQGLSSIVSDTFHVTALASQHVLPSSPEQFSDTLIVISDVQQTIEESPPPLPPRSDDSNAAPSSSSPPEFSVIAVNAQSQPIEETSTSSTPTPSANPGQPSTAETSSRANQRSSSTGTSAARRGRSLAGRWPHRLSSVLALIGCTLGLNNVCRFGLLSVTYGANFVVQWLILSLLFGVPLLSFHMSIGQYLSSGIVGMWKISPIFQGIGVGLLFAQMMVGLYSTVGVSWMLIYFRDSFVTRGDQYRWAKCVREFRDCDPYQQNVTDLQDSVPDYFHAVVLQRSTPDYPSSVYVPNSLKFTVAFNLAVVWMLIFVSLSKGLKSYGKVIHGFVLAPVGSLFVLTFKMVGMVDSASSLFSQTSWGDFFFNTQTWVVAGREVFFTWGLLGACVMQITSHNRHSHPLKSDAMIVVLVTTMVLLLSAFVGNSCVSIIQSATPSSATTHFQSYSYFPSSFESDRSYKFLKVVGGKPYGPEDTLMQLSSHYHNPLLMGVKILRDGKGEATVSGYQVLRVATELFPTAMASLSPSGISPFWTVLFYFTLVLFGLAQQLAIWHSVIKGLIAVKQKVLRSWETTITFFVCALGFALGLPLCTETGIYVTYFLDFSIGSGWWIMILYLLELVAVFIVRGSPYCGENIVTVLVTGAGRLAKFFGPLISFIWNVIMPVALLVLSITSFKSGNSKELFDWNPNRAGISYVFWPSWMREVGSLLQLLPILAVPLVAILQSCRYLTTGPADIVERLQQLYRPNTRFGPSASESSRSRASGTNRREDPPPKYTPPPSYSTATGAKIARFLRNSIRRSVRRITSATGSPGNLPPPPTYATVILEINNSQQCSTSSLPPEYAEATAQAARSTQAVKNLESKLDPLRSLLPTPKKLLGHTLSSDFSRKERLSSSRRISSEISSRDIARMLSLRAEEAISTASANAYGPSPQTPGPSNAATAPPFPYRRESLEKIDYNFESLEPSTSRRLPFDILSYNRSRNRNSNDSQLALISDGFLYDNGNAGSLNSSSTNSHSCHVEVDIDMRLQAEDRRQTDA